MFFLSLLTYCRQLFGPKHTLFLTCAYSYFGIQLQHCINVILEGSKYEFYRVFQYEIKETRKTQLSVILPPCGTYRATTGVTKEVFLTRNLCILLDLRVNRKQIGLTTI